MSRIGRVESHVMAARGRAVRGEWPSAAVAALTFPFTCCLTRTSEVLRITALGLGQRRILGHGSRHSKVLKTFGVFDIATQIAQGILTAQTATPRL